MKRGLAPSIAAAGLVLLGGCSDGRDDPAGAGRGGWAIPPGTYGNVVQDGGGGAKTGVELRLAQGDESETITIVLCDAGCGAAQTRPIRRGLNGVSFTLPTPDGTADVSIQPDGPDAVSFNLHGGAGLRTERLPRIASEGEPVAPSGA